jgi:hypothetical protein
MVIRGYIDESYSGDQRSGVFTLSCLFIRQESLAWIELAWLKAIEDTNADLVAKGKRPISRYHATECNSRKNEFEGWDEEERNAFVRKLFKVLRNHQTTHMSFSVDLRDLLEIWPENITDALSFAYNTLMKLIMLEIGRIMEEERMSEKIEFVFERGPGDAALIGAYDAMMADPSFKYKAAFRSIVRNDWSRSMSLQIADLVAYESYKEASRQTSTVARGRRKSLEALLTYDSFGALSKGLPAAAIQELRRLHEEALKRKAETTEMVDIA